MSLSLARPALKLIYTHSKAWARPRPAIAKSRPRRRFRAQSRPRQQSKPGGFAQREGVRMERASAPARPQASVRTRKEIEQHKPRATVHKHGACNSKTKQDWKKKKGAPTRLWLTLTNGARCYASTSPSTALATERFVGSCGAASAPSSTLYFAGPSGAATPRDAYALGRPTTALSGSAGLPSPRTS